MIEYEKLDAALHYFSNNMQEKLHSKCREGRRGWDNRKNKKHILESLINHAHELYQGDVAQITDIANFAMMLWWQMIPSATRMKMMNKYHKRVMERGDS